MKTNHYQPKTMLFTIAMTVLVSVEYFHSYQIAKAGTIIVQPDFTHQIQVKYASPIGETFQAEDQHISTIGFWLHDFSAPPNPQYPISASIELFQGVGIDGQSLGTAPIEDLIPGFNGFFDADFSFVNLTHGEMYTAIVSSPNGRPGIVFDQWRSLLGEVLYDDPYINGNLIMFGNIDYNADAAFRVIPEPATLFLLGLGAVMVRLRSSQVIRRRKV